MMVCIYIISLLFIILSHFLLVIYKNYFHLVDGGWTEFSDWSDCTATCGGGTEIRTRTCSNPTPANGGAECTGSDVETQTCGDVVCPGKYLECIVMVIIKPILCRNCENGYPERSAFKSGSHICARFKFCAYANSIL